MNDEFRQEFLDLRGRIETRFRFHTHGADADAVRRVSVEVTTIDCGLQHTRNGRANATECAACMPLLPQLRK
jgi:hypothetical protein